MLASASPTNSAAVAAAVAAAPAPPPDISSVSHRRPRCRNLSLDMRAGKEKYQVSGRTQSVRKLPKSELGGVIFGCTHATKDECLKKQLFGLPSSHFSYVRNIEPGLPLFLFNYSSRKLDGIYEAASQGQMDMDLNAWTTNGTGRTTYPAQVRFRARTQCRQLDESQFRNIIKDNYHKQYHFWFELDHEQTNRLIALFEPLHNPHRTIPVPNLYKWKELAPALEAEFSSNESEREETVSGSEVDCSEENVQGSPSRAAGPHLDGESRSISEKVPDAEAFEAVLRNLQNLKADFSSPKVFADGGDTQGAHERLRFAQEPLVLDVENKTVGELPLDMHEESRLQESREHNSTSSVLFHDNSELVQIIKMLKGKTEELEKKQVESDIKMRQFRNESGKAIEDLKTRVKELESKQSIVGLPSNSFVNGNFGSEKLIYLIGCYDGSTWFPSLESFSPSLDIVKPLKSMSVVLNCASAVALNGNIYTLGGREYDSWLDTVQCYSPEEDEWSFSPHLICPKWGLAGATMDGKIYAIGGSYDNVHLSDVEMFDPALGRWINIQPMLQKRFAPAAAELHGVLYTVGGVDGTDYLQSAERYDPRVAYWTNLASMNMPRGGHGLAAFNDKLYAIGGFDGGKMLSSVEIFDPRLGAWMVGEPLSSARGYSASAILDGTIFVIGGMQDNELVLDTVECYKEGTGWTVTDFKSIGERSVFTAVVL